MGVTLLAAAVAGCAGEDQGASDSCPSLVTFGGKDYEERTSGAAELPTDRKLGLGRLPDCGDVNDDPGGPGPQVEVWSLDGVPARQALAATQAGELHLYVALDVEDPCAVKYTAC